MVFLQYYKYERKITRRPLTTGILLPRILLKMPFKKMKSFFFQKNTLSSSNFLFFPNLIILHFSARSLTIKKWNCRHIFLKISHSTAILPPRRFQVGQSFDVFEKSYYFNLILRQICYNLVINNTNSKLSGHWDMFNWHLNVKNRTGSKDDFPSIL